MKYFPHYGVSGLLIFITCLVLGSFAFLKNRKSELNRVLALVNFTVAIYGLGFFGIEFLAHDKISAYRWWQLMYAGVIFIAPVNLHLVYLISEEKKDRTVFTVYLAAFFFWCINLLFPALFFKDITLKFSKVWYCTATPLFSFFFLFWISIVVFLAFYILNYYRVASHTIRLKIKYYIIGVLMGYSGGCVSYLPMFGIDVYNYSNYSVIAFPILTGYAIIRYHFMEIDTVVHRTILWLTTSLWLVLPAYIVFNYARYWMQSLSTVWLTVSALGLFYIFLWYYSYFQPKIDHLFRRRKYDYQAIMDTIAEKVSTTINIEDLKEQLLSEICKTMYLRNSLLFVLSKDEKQYLLIGRLGYKSEENHSGRFDSVSCDSKLSKWITEHKDILEKEQVKINPYYEPIKEEASALFSAQNLELMVPLILENKINGILGLGKKENLQAYTTKDIQLLKKLGQEVGVTVFNALHYKDLLEKDRLEEELRMGKEIQTALLPKKLPEIPGLTFSGLMLPAKEIGGDYYDFIKIGPSEEDLAIAIGDVSGKGVGAGLIMAAAKATLKGLSQQCLSPKEMLFHANNILYEYTAGQKFMTMLYLIYKSKEKTLYYSSAGHERLFLYRHSANSIEAIQLGGFMLGVVPDIGESIEEKQITLNPKDKILLYTDGVTEAQSPSGERFGLDRLIESFKSHSQKAPHEMIQEIKSDVYSFMQTQPQYDDITLVGMEAGE